MRKIAYIGAVAHVRSRLCAKNRIHCCSSPCPRPIVCEKSHTMPVRHLCAESYHTTAARTQPCRDGHLLHQADLLTYSANPIQHIRNRRFNILFWWDLGTKSAPFG